MEGPTTKRDFREKRKSGEVFPLGGSGDPPPENFCIFELPRLDFRQKGSLIFRQKGTLLGGPKPFSEGGGGGGLGCNDTDSVPKKRVFWAGKFVQ